MRTGCAILMQTGSGPSLGITRCQLCHLPCSRDLLLDMSRFNPQLASFRIWIASLISFTLLCLSLLTLSLFSLFLCRSQFSTFRVYLVLGQDPSHFLAKYERRRVRVGNNWEVHECIHSSGLALKGACNNVWYSGKFYFSISRNMTKRSFRPFLTRGFEEIEMLLNLNIKSLSFCTCTTFNFFIIIYWERKKFSCKYFLILFSFILI